MSGSYTLVTAPTVDPVSLAEVKNFLKIEDSVTEDDALIAALTKAAIGQAQSYLNRKLITQTWDLKLDRFPCEEIQLSFGCLQSVSSVTYLDTAGTSQSWNSSLYQVDTAGVFGRIQPAYAQVYPSTYPVINAVTIRFVCGYGPTASDVPEEIRTGLLMTIQNWYDQRCEGQMPKIAEWLFGNFQLLDFSG